jgi:hypothetical protein
LAFSLVLCACARSGLPYPGAVFVRRPLPGDPLGGARPVAADDHAELGPVDLAEAVAAALGVLAQLGVGQGDAELVRLRHRHVNEPLPQLVVGVPLDASGHRLLCARQTLVVGEGAGQEP